MNNIRVFVIACALMSIYWNQFRPQTGESPAMVQPDESLTDWEVAIYIEVLKDIQCNQLDFSLALARHGIGESEWARLDQEVYLALAAFRERYLLIDLRQIDATMARLRSQVGGLSGEELQITEEEIIILENLREGLVKERVDPTLRERDIRGADLIEKWLPNFIEVLPCQWQHPRKPGKPDGKDMGAPLRQKPAQAS